MNLRELRQEAAKHELSLNFIAKDLMISKILFKLQNIPGIVFKEGTAINRVHLKRVDIMRFSEDIDMDFNGNLKAALQETQKIVKNLQFNISKPKVMNSTIRYDLFYINPLNHKDKIRLEFTAGKIHEKFSGQVVNFGFVPFDASFLNVYEKNILIKHKITCVCSRKEGKDLYDLYHLCDGYNFIKTEKTKLAKALLMDKKEIKSIANSSNHYISIKKRPDWEALIEELKKKAHFTPIQL